MGGIEKDLLARPRLDDTHTVVGAAEGDVLSVGRPAGAIDGIEGDGQGCLQFRGGHVPDLHLAHAAGEAAGDRDLAPVRGKGQRFDALREPDEAGGEAGAVGAVDEHLVEAGYGDQLAVGRVVERGDDGGHFVDGRVVAIVARTGVLGRIIGGTFLDPAAHQGDLVHGQRIVFLRHLGGAVLSRENLFEQVAAGSIVGDDGFSGLPAGDQLVEGRHHVVALRLGRLVTPLALGLENRTDVAVVADGVAGLIGGAE